MSHHHIAALPSLALLLAAALLGSLGAGCASPPPQASKIADAPMGTVITYHRKSSGSLGTFDGQVVWTYSPSTWQGRPVVAVGAPQAGIMLHEPASLGLVASLSANGQAQASFSPPIDYQWPLQVGKAWTSEHQLTNHANGRTVTLRIDYKVESWGDVTVPAGTFKAFKLVWTTSLGESETRWVAPDAGIATVKRHVERVASHPQGVGVLDAELLSRTLPKVR